MASYETLLYELKENILTVTLNRPDKLNAINGQMEDEIDQALAAADADESVRVVILTGAGRAFSSGYDMSKNAMPPWREVGIHGAVEANRGRASKHNQRMLRVWTMTKPVIAAINGYALAGGLELAMMCDFRYAADTAMVGEPEIRHFSGPPTLILPWIVNMGQVKELLLTGDNISAKEAFRIGLINQIFPPEQLMAETWRIAKKICLIHPLALKLNKQTINRTYEMMGLMNALNINIELGTLHHSYAQSVNEELFQLQSGSAKEFIKAREAAFREFEKLR